MNTESGLSLSQPVAVWNKPLKANFKDLFKALGKGVVDGVTGQWGGLVKDLVDVSVAVGLANDPEQIAWLLIYRALTQAIASLVEDSKDLLVKLPDDLEGFSDHLDLSLENNEFAMGPDFFQSPQTLPIVEAIQTPLIQWLEGFVSESVQAQAIASRLPTYFVFALDQEWRQRSQEYQILTETIDTPFTKASDREQAWRLYSAWLQKQIDEPMFLEAFGLQQVYVPLNAYYRRQGQIAPVEAGIRSQKSETYERVVIDLEEELEAWLQTADRNDAIRILSGGPGSGKSSFAKIFAVHQSAKGLRVLFIPLHQFDPTGDLEKAVGCFIGYDAFLSFNPLDRDQSERRLLIIFDGLDELALQGKISKEVAQNFIREVQRKVERFNYQETRLQIVISGREVVVQDNSSDFRQPGQILHLLSYFVPEEKREREADEQFVDPKKQLNLDQRDIWWRRYGEISGRGYQKLPKELDRGNLVEITAQPLLDLSGI